MNPAELDAFVDRLLARPRLRRVFLGALIRGAMEHERDRILGALADGDCTAPYESPCQCCIDTLVIVTDSVEHDSV